MHVGRLKDRPSLLAILALLAALVVAVLISTERGNAYTATRFKVVLAGSGLQTGTVTAGAPTQIKLIALNNDNTTIDTTYNGDFTITLSGPSASALGTYQPTITTHGDGITPPGAALTLGSPVTLHFTNGQSDTDGVQGMLSLVKEEVASLDASDGTNGIASLVSTRATITVNHDVPARLKITTTDVGNLVAGTERTLVLTALDAWDNPAPEYGTGNKTLQFALALGVDASATVTNNLGTAVAVGANTTIHFTSGVSDTGSQLHLHLQKAQSVAVGALDTLAVPPVASIPFDGLLVTVDPAADDHLTVITQPTQSVRGSALATSPAVEIRDEFDNVTTSTASVTVSLAANATRTASGGVLSGATPLNATSGVATFGGLSVDKSGTSYALDFASSGLAGTTSSTFTVTGSAKLRWVTGSSTANAGSPVTPVPQVEVLRDDNVRETTDTGRSIALTPGDAGATALTASGLATFSGFTINAAGSPTVTASATGLTSATSPAFSIAATTSVPSCGQGSVLVGGSCVPVPVITGVTVKGGKAVGVPASVTEVTLTGTNFPAAISELTSVTYGRSGIGSTCTDPKVVTAGSSFTCSVGTDVPNGGSVAFVVSVKGASSAASTAVYRAGGVPTISTDGVFVARLGVPMSLAGTNFFDGVVDVLVGGSSYPCIENNGKGGILFATRASCTIGDAALVGKDVVYRITTDFGTASSNPVTLKPGGIVTSVTGDVTLEGRKGLARPGGKITFTGTALTAGTVTFANGDATATCSNVKAAADGTTVSCTLGKAAAEARLQLDLSSAEPETPGRSDVVVVREAPNVTDVKQSRAAGGTVVATIAATGISADTTVTYGAEGTGYSCTKLTRTLKGPAGALTCGIDPTVPAGTTLHFSVTDDGLTALSTDGVTIPRATTLVAGNPSWIPGLGWSVAVTASSQGTGSEAGATGTLTLKQGTAVVKTLKGVLAPTGDTADSQFLAYPRPCLPTTYTVTFTPDDPAQFAASTLEFTDKGVATPFTVDIGLFDGDDPTKPAEQPANALFLKDQQLYLHLQAHAAPGCTADVVPGLTGDVVVSDANATDPTTANVWARKVAAADDGTVKLAASSGEILSGPVTAEILTSDAGDYTVNVTLAAGTFKAAGQATYRVRDWKAGVNLKRVDETAEVNPDVPVQLKASLQVADGLPSAGTMKLKVDGVVAGSMTRDASGDYTGSVTLDADAAGSPRVVTAYFTPAAKRTAYAESAGVALTAVKPLAPVTISASGTIWGRRSGGSLNIVNTKAHSGKLIIHDGTREISPVLRLPAVKGYTYTTRDLRPQLSPGSHTLWVSVDASGEYRAITYDDAIARDDLHVNVTVPDDSTSTVLTVAKDDTLNAKVTATDAKAAAPDDGTVSYFEERVLKDGSFATTGDGTPLGSAAYSAAAGAPAAPAFTCGSHGIWAAYGSSSAFAESTSAKRTVDVRFPASVTVKVAPAKVGVDSDSSPDVTAVVAPAAVKSAPCTLDPAQFPSGKVVFTVQKPGGASTTVDGVNKRSPGSFAAKGAIDSEWTLPTGVLPIGEVGSVAISATYVPDEASAFSAPDAPGTGSLAVSKYPVLTATIGETSDPAPLGWVPRIGKPFVVSGTVDVDEPGSVPGGFIKVTIARGANSVVADTGRWDPGRGSNVWSIDSTRFAGLGALASQPGKYQVTVTYTPDQYEGGLPKSTKLVLDLRGYDPELSVDYRASSHNPDDRAGFSAYDRYPVAIRMRTGASALSDTTLAPTVTLKRVSPAATSGAQSTWQVPIVTPSRTAFTQDNRGQLFAAALVPPGTYDMTVTLEAKGLSAAQWETSTKTLEGVVIDRPVPALTATPALGADQIVFTVKAVGPAGATVPSGEVKVFEEGGESSAVGVDLGPDGSVAVPIVPASTTCSTNWRVRYEGDDNYHFATNDDITLAIPPTRWTLGALEVFRDWPKGVRAPVIVSAPLSPAAGTPVCRDATPAVEPTYALAKGGKVVALLGSTNEIINSTLSSSLDISAAPTGSFKLVAALAPKADDGMSPTAALAKGDAIPAGDWPDINIRDTPYTVHVSTVPAKVVAGTPVKIVATVSYAPEEAQLGSVRFTTGTQQASAGSGKVVAGSFSVDHTFPAAGNTDLVAELAEQGSKIAARDATVIDVLHAEPLGLGVSVAVGDVTADPATTTAAVKGVAAAGASYLVPANAIISLTAKADTGGDTTTALKYAWLVSPSASTLADSDFGSAPATQFRAPAAGGSVVIDASVTGEHWEAGKFHLTLTSIAAATQPVVTSVAGTPGTPGSTVAVTGTGFTSASTVGYWVDGGSSKATTACPVAGDLDGATLSCTIGSSLKPGTRLHFVVTTSQVASATSAAAAEFVVAKPVRISGVAPQTLLPGHRVTLSGVGFDAGSTVAYGIGTAAPTAPCTAPAYDAKAKTLTCLLPDDDALWGKDVTFAVTTGTDGTSDASSSTPVASAGVASVTPSPVTPGSSFAVTFRSGDSTPSLTITSPSDGSTDTTISCVVDSAAKGRAICTVPGSHAAVDKLWVGVSGADGGAVADFAIAGSSADQRIIDVTPVTGDLAATITVNGTGFETSMVATATASGASVGTCTVGDTTKATCTLDGKKIVNGAKVSFAVGTASSGYASKVDAFTFSCGTPPSPFTAWASEPGCTATGAQVGKYVSNPNTNDGKTANDTSIGVNGGAQQDGGVSLTIQKDTTIKDDSTGKNVNTLSMTSRDISQSNQQAGQGTRPALQITVNGNDAGSGGGQGGGPSKGSTLSRTALFRANLQQSLLNRLGPLRGSTVVRTPDNSTITHVRRTGRAATADAEARSRGKLSRTILIQVSVGEPGVVVYRKTAKTLVPLAVSGADGVAVVPIRQVPTTLVSIRGAGAPAAALAGQDGGLRSLGAAAPASRKGTRTAAPVIGAGASGLARGGATITAAGRVATWGNVRFRGSASSMQLGGSTAAAIGVMPFGTGYWVAGANGRVVAFGAARDFGSLPRRSGAAPVIALLPSADGNGYQLVQADGRVTAFGDAVAVKGLAPRFGRVPLVAAASVAGGLGILVTDAQGQVQALGAARRFGSQPAGSRARIVGIVPTGTGLGYVLVSQNGSQYLFGDALGLAPATGGAAAQRSLGPVAAVAS